MGLFERRGPRRKPLLEPERCGRESSVYLRPLETKACNTGGCHKGHSRGLNRPPLAQIRSTAEWLRTPAVRSALIAAERLKVGTNLSVADLLHEGIQITGRLRSLS